MGEGVELGDRLDPLDHAAHAQIGGQPDRGAQDGHAGQVVGQPGGEGAVDLEAGDRQGRQVVERGVPGAEVVDGDTDAVGPQAVADR